METVLVAIFVGAFSGLLGAVISPFVNLLTDRKRRLEQRQEERDRGLRRMIESVMQLARMAVSDTLEIEITETISGADMQQVLRSQMERLIRLESEYRDFTWRPHRIEDPRLRELATSLNFAQGQLYILIGARRGFYVFTDTTNWHERTRNARRWVDLLLEAVDKRMDKLDW